MRTVQDRFAEYAEYAPRSVGDVVMAVAAGGDPGYLADYIAQNIAVDFQVKQQILEELNVTKRLTCVIRLLTDETEILKIESEIQDQLKDQIDRNQREYYLREQTQGHPVRDWESRI